MIGVRMTANIRPMCCGRTTVPRNSPSEAAVQLASTSINASIGQLATRMCTAVAGNAVMIGKITAPARAPWNAPNATLASGTVASGIGARTRSSISRVAPSSIDSGNATAAMDVNTIATATSPGTSTVARVLAPAATGRCWPVRGSTYVNTNTVSTGFMTVRRVNGNQSRRSTRKSRGHKPSTEARTELRSATEVAPRESDEHRLERRLCHGEIGQVMLGDAAHDTGHRTVVERDQHAQAAVSLHDLG